MRARAKILKIMVLACVATSQLVACSEPKSENEALLKTHHKIVEDYETVSHINASSLSDMHASEYVLFDVREAEEFAVSHIEGAIWVDPAIDAESFLSLYRDLIEGRAIVLYCSVGVRSSRLAKKIQTHEASPISVPIYNLETGIFGWHNEKRPLVRISQNSANQTDFIHPYNRIWGRMVNRAELKKYNPE